MVNFWDSVQIATSWEEREEAVVCYPPVASEKFLPESFSAEEAEVRVGGAEVWELCSHCVASINSATASWEEREEAVASSLQGALERRHLEQSLEYSVAALAVRAGSEVVAVASCVTPWFQSPSPSAKILSFLLLPRESGYVIHLLSVFVRHLPAIRIPQSESADRLGGLAILEASQTSGVDPSDAAQHSNRYERRKRNIGRIDTNFASSP